ncbi:DUF2339 domain-containing protein [Aestuariirhabdus haliotis]|uniref:DUF2339 domain-containing protein n=1 Tax=Aestuariirhabdus haliotis TaxID=2918751 RepID=UPI0020C10371|nr:DUF2339 domain-containing protein [Aestuariirhabdus haliotis]MCL6420743.1 DUF2339 domain-containing protein [Aestuariirhabdus haliotis]
MPVLLTLAVVLAAYLIEGFRSAMVLGLVVGLGCFYYHFTQKMRAVESEVARLRDALREAQEAFEPSNQSINSAAQQDESLNDIELDIELDLDLDTESPETARLTEASPSGASRPEPLPEPVAAPAMADSPVSAVPVQSNPSSQPSMTGQPISAESVEQADTEVDPWSGRHIKPAPVKARAQTPSRHRPGTGQPSLADQLVGLITNYFSDGNLFVRIGILVLFFGVAFLLKYAAENSNLSMEVRFLGAALGGLGLLGLGWRLRQSKPAYALLLQGAGIGISYITIFAAFQLQPLLSSGQAFVLMGLLSLITALLAIKQDSRALAIAGIVGGFLAPLLTASNSGNYIGLFSYYLALDLVVLAIAWHKTWRALNLIGLFFTFGVFGLWFHRNYHDDLLLNTELFLILYFLLYSIIGVLYAFRQPLKLRGYVDGTLVFGTPMLAFGFQAALVHTLEYGIAISAAAFGAYYLALAALFWGRAGSSFRLLAESMLAIGVVFLTLAVPYALDGFWTTATWTLEAAAILWVAIKQQRQYTQYFAAALQLGAGVLFLATSARDIGDNAFLNPAFMGGVLIALAGLLSAWLLYKLRQTVPDSWLAQCHSLFFVWGLLWWLGSASVQIEQYLDQYRVVGYLLLFCATAWAGMFLSIQRRWQWRPAELGAALLIPALALLAVAGVALNGHALFVPDTLFWLAAFALSYFILYQLEAGSLKEETMALLYLAWLLTLVAVLSIELDWRFAEFASNTEVAIGQGWQGSMIAIIPLVVMVMIYRFNVGALQRFGESLRMNVVAVLGMLAVLWFLGMCLLNNGESLPMRYTPLINPLEFLQLLYWWFALRLLSDLRRRDVMPDGLLAAMAGLGFIWINSVLLRALHHSFDIPYQLDDLLQDIRVQISLSILWAILGSLVMLASSRMGWRTPWKIGGALVGIVLVKMVMVDLGASGTIERIVSFLVVGSLLVGMGYFSPIPEKESEQPAKKEADADPVSP